MPKLRKMLGDARHPTVLSLMRLMETQSHETLVRWATACVRERYLPLAEDARLFAALAAAEGWLKGELSLKAAQAPLREARQAAGAEADPVRQAAARAIATACAAIRTPTSALGFVFYGAPPRHTVRRGWMPQRKYTTRWPMQSLKRCFSRCRKRQ